MAVVVARQMFLPYLFDLADVMPRGRWYSSIVWQMLLPICGRCFYHYSVLQLFGRLMLLPSGRWNSHLLLDYKFSWADVIALWQME